MIIKTLQSKYIQKSRIFLYPFLGIKRGVSITPIQTYMSIKGMYSINDYKFICLYHLRKDQDFKHFEKHIILNNKYFCKFYEMKDDNESKGIYIFDFNGFSKTWDSIIIGKYSKISKEHKNIILNFFRQQYVHQTHIMSYLNPTKFIPQYAKLLNVDEKVLQKIGELCNPPNLIQENLIIDKKIINFGHINNLQTNKTII